MWRAPLPTPGELEATPKFTLNPGNRYELFTQPWTHATVDRLLNTGTGQFVVPGPGLGVPNAEMHIAGNGRHPGDA